MEGKRKNNEYLYNLKDNRKNEKTIKELMKNNILTLRKQDNKKKIISKIKNNNNMNLYSTVEKNYFLLYSSFKIPNILSEYYNNLKNKNLYLYYLINNEEQIITKFNIDKNNLTKFILFQLNYYIEYMISNCEVNIDNMKNFFDDNIIHKLINIIHEYSDKNNINETSVNINDNEIIIYNICKILVKLTSISNYYIFFIINNDNNIQLLYYCLKYYNKINQILSNNLLILIYNCYLENNIEILNRCNNLIPFFLENLSNYHNNPMENIMQLDYLINIIDFLSDLLNELTFNTYMNNPYINDCILLMINIFQNYNNENIKYISMKCLISLLHCIDENNIIKINNFQNLIHSLLNYLDIEKNKYFIVIKTLEVISLLTYLYEIDQFINNDLIDTINHILFFFVIHKDQSKTLLLNKNEYKEFNIFIKNISIILLNCCLSEKVYYYFIYNIFIIKIIIIIIYNYSIELSTLKNLYNFLNEFTNNEDNFMALVLANFLEIGIVQSLDKYLDIRNYEVISIILNFTFKSLEYGNILIDKNNEKNRYYKINFVKAFLEKKGFKDKINLIISPDFGNNKCSDLAKNLKEIYF